jgi:type IV secretion system protein VirD4
MDTLTVLAALGLAIVFGFHFFGIAGAFGALVLFFAIDSGKHFFEQLHQDEMGNTIDPFGNGAYIPPPEPERQTFKRATVPTHGGARFATYAEARSKNLVPVSSEQLTRGIYLGTQIEPDEESLTNKWTGTRRKPLIYGGNQNALTAAPTRSGKGAAFIIATLLLCMDSLFCLDVKGENWFVTLCARIQMGHDVIMINPFNLFGEELGLSHLMTNHYNPFDALRPDQRDFIENIEKLAAAIVITDPNEHQKYFSDSANLLTSVLMAIICSDPTIPAEDRNLPYLYDLLGLEETKFGAFMERAYRTNSLPYVRSNAAGFYVQLNLGKDGEPPIFGANKRIDEIKSTARSQLKFLNHTGIREFLSYSDFDFADLRRKPTSVFCMMTIPQLGTYYRFARLMVQCLFNAVIVAPQPNDRNILVVLDEQASLGNLETLQTAVSTFPGYGVRVWSIFQDLNQMERIYGDPGWRTFMSSAGVIQCMTPNDLKTAKEFSERAGNYTLTRTHTGQNTQSNAFGAASNQREGEQVSEENMGIPLLSPEDLYGMPDLAAGKNARSVLFVNGLSFPFIQTRDPYYGDKPNQAGIFHGRPYAPNPMERGNAQAAYDWMKNYLAGDFQNKAAVETPA